MAILIMLLILSAIIVIHEYGHFIAARKCGVFVEEFAIGMGPKIWGKEKKGTLYSIRIFPLGGYCKMKDEDSKSTDTDSFGNATKLKKFIILFAGAFMNFVLAIVLFIGILLFSGVSTTEIASVYEDFPAYAAGIQPGDQVYKINGQRIRIFNDITYELAKNKGEALDIVIKRNGEYINFTIEPVLQGESYLIGITSKAKTPIFGEKVDGFESATFFETVYNGYWNMVFVIKSTIVGVFELITGQVDFNTLTGPIGLTPKVGETYEEASKDGFLTILLTMLNLTAFLSANIGVMNLLPIPALDGGRILFLAIEVVRGKPISEEREGTIHFIGFVILIALGIFIAFKDLITIFF